MSSFSLTRMFVNVLEHFLIFVYIYTIIEQGGGFRAQYKNLVIFFQTWYIFPLLLPKPTEICAHAMPRTTKGQQKVPILKHTTGLCPSRSYNSMTVTLKSPKRSEQL